MWLRSACVRASIIQAGAHRQPGMCHRRNPSGLHLSFGGGRRGFTGTAERLSFAFPQTAFWFGVKPFPQQAVGNKVELKEVSLGLSAPWHKSLTRCQRCCVASQNWDLIAAVVCRPVCGASAQKHWCCVPKITVLTSFSAGTVTDWKPYTGCQQYPCPSV